MKHLIKIFIAFCLFSNVTMLQAQETVLSSGGEALGTGGTASYSIGQTVYSTHTGTNGSIVEGMQQPFEISIVTEIEQAKNINLVCSAYPNPATDVLTLNVENIEYSDLHFQLYDMNGKLLETKKLTDYKTSISMDNLVSAIYFLKVYTENQEIKSFKIIKK